MSKVEALRQALLVLSNASCEELSAYIRDQFHLDVDPRFVPILKATLLDKDALANRRRPVVPDTA